MKIIVPVLAFSTLFISSSFAKEYILDKKGFINPVGTVYETAEALASEDFILKIAGPQNQEMMINGVMKMNNSRKTTILSEKSYEVTLLSHEENNKMTMNGQALPNPPATPQPLLKIPIIYSFENDTWSAKAKEGEFTELQQEEVDEKVSSLNKPHSPYSYEAKKIGDTWETDISKSTGFFASASSNNTTGSVKMKFLGIEDYAGHQCAKLEATFSITGKGDKGIVDISMKGSAIIHRSLTHFIDLSVKAKALEMGMESPQPKMSGKGAFEASETVTFK